MTSASPATPSTHAPVAPPPAHSRGLAAARLTRGVLDSGLALGVFLLAAVAPNLGLGYLLTPLTQVLVYVVVLASLVVLAGYVGQISLCQVSFMGLGAFLTAALMEHYGLSFWLAGALAAVLVFGVGVLVGLPALRLRGLTLAIVTLSLALLADNFIFVDIGWLNNESNGWRIVRPHLFALNLDDAATLYRVILIAAALTILAVARLRRGRTGKSWYAMRDAEIAASTSGVSVVSMKLLGFGIAAGIAGLGGALFTLTYASVSATSFTFVYSIQLLAIAVIAGIRSLPGAVLGALFYVLLPQFLLRFPSLSPLTSLILGAGLVLQMLFAPQGLGGLLEEAETRIFRRLAGASARQSKGGDDAAR